MAFSERSIRVLCFSRDPLLLESRQQVLATKYESVTVGTTEEMMALASCVQFDVIVFSHTISAEECDLCAEIVRTRWPEAKIVALSAEQEGCSEAADRVVRGLDGPRVLLNAIDQLGAN
jgi:DNA-binding NarL/FixJ family response regulator